MSHKKIAPTDINEQTMGDFSEPTTSTVQVYRADITTLWNSCSRYRAGDVYAVVFLKTIQGLVMTTRKSDCTLSNQQTETRAAEFKCLFSSTQKTEKTDINMAIGVWQNTLLPNTLAAPRLADEIVWTVS